MRFNRSGIRTRCGPPRAIQSRWLGSWWPIESGEIGADECRASRLEYRTNADRLHLLEALRQHADEPMMQGAALIVLIMGARIVLKRLRLRRIGRSDSGHFRCIEMSVLMQDIDINQTRHAPELREQEQAKQPWAEALKPSKHRPMPVRRA